MSLLRSSPLTRIGVKPTSISRAALARYNCRDGYDAIRRAIVLSPTSHEFYGAIFGTRPPEPVELDGSPAAA